MPRRFALLDRDGTLIRNIDFLADPDRVELLPGTAEALRRLRKLGFGLVVISNQSGVGRGLVRLDQLAAVNARLVELLAADGVALDGLYFCPHVSEDDCHCRKPRPGMVEQAVRDLHFDPALSIVIGDNVCDLDLARTLGIPAILVRTGHGETVLASGVQPAHVANDLLAAVEIIETLS